MSKETKKQSTRNQIHKSQFSSASLSPPDQKIQSEESRSQREERDSPPPPPLSTQPMIVPDIRGP